MESPFSIDEIIHEIIRWLDGKDRFYLSIANKQCRRSYLFFKDIQGRFGDLQLSLEQIEALSKIQKAPHEKLVLIAPPSFGKTVIGLGYIFDGFNPKLPVSSVDRVLLTCPNTCIRIWLAHIIELFPQFFDKDPLKSHVLIDDICKKRHADYLTTAVQNGAISDKVKLVICSSNRSLWRYNGSAWQIRRAAPQHQYTPGSFFGTVVADEVHLSDPGSLTYGGLAQGRIQKLLGLTATNNARTLGEGYHKIEVSHKVIENVIPSYKYHCRKNTLDGSIKEAIARKHNRIVIFQNYGISAKAVKVIGERYDIPCYRFVQGLNPIEKFHTASRALLFCDYKSASVGHSLKGDAGIFFDLESIPPTALHQAMSRLLRITNKIDEVSYYINVQNELIVKLLLGLVELKRQDNFQLTGSEIRKAMNFPRYPEIIKLLGLNQETITAIELLWICFPRSRKLKRWFDQLPQNTPEHRKLIKEMK